MQVAADVKCYYCGHVSGQLVGQRERLAAGSFRPRPGYHGDPPKPGERIRCERCKGPVFLEDVTALELPVMARKRPARREARKLSGAA